jgi:hypothetical protein
MKFWSKTLPFFREKNISKIRVFDFFSYSWIVALYNQKLILIQKLFHCAIFWDNATRKNYIVKNIWKIFLEWFNSLLLGTNSYFLLWVNLRNGRNGILQSVWNLVCTPKRGESFPKIDKFSSKWARQRGTNLPQILAGKNWPPFAILVGSIRKSIVSTGSI